MISSTPKRDVIAELKKMAEGGPDEDESGLDNFTKLAAAPQ